MFDDDGPTGRGISRGNAFELAAAEIFVLELVKKELKDKLYRGDGAFGFRFPIAKDKSRFDPDELWIRTVTLPEFREVIDDLASELKKARH